MNIFSAVSILPAIGLFGIFIATSPSKWSLKDRKDYYLGKIGLIKEDSPFKRYVDNLKAKRKKEKMILELSQSLAYIENIVVLGRGQKISADLLLEELAEFCPSLSGVFVNMAKDIAFHEKEHASMLLYKKINEPFAKDIGIFLAGWEDIPQEEMFCSIKAYKDILREIRSTKLRNKDELISDLVYFPVVLNCMMVLMNFVYIAYFIEQKEALMMMF